MPALRASLAQAGFDDVRTYVQSGNIVLGSGDRADAVTRMVQRLIADEFGLDIAVVTRTRAQLAKVVERNPLARVAKDPKRYQVSFLDAKPPRDFLAVIRRAFKKFNGDHMTSIAAALAYYAFMAIPAALLVAVGVFGLFAGPNAITTVIDKLNGILPGQATSLLEGSLKNLTQH